MTARTVHSVAVIDSNALFDVLGRWWLSTGRRPKRLVLRDGRHVSIKGQRPDWLLVGVACPRTGIGARKAEKVTQYGVEA